MRKKLLLSIALAAVFLAVAARNVSWMELRLALASARWGWMAPLAVVLTAAQLARALRYWLIVRAVKEIPLARVATTAFAGFMALNVLPLRAGEVARPLLLRSRDGVPLAAGLATVVAERVVDVMAVFGLLLATLFVVPSRTLAIGGSTFDLRQVARVLLALFVPAGLFLVALIALRQTLVTRIERGLSVVSVRLASVVAKLLAGFVGGLGIFRDAKGAAAVGALTGVVWGLHVAGMAIGFPMLRLDLPLEAAIAVLAITMAGITIPGGIGMSGNFQLFCVAALSLYGVAESQGFAFSVVMNATGFAVAVAMGVASLPFLGTGFGSLVPGEAPTPALDPKAES